MKRRNVETSKRRNGRLPITVERETSLFRRLLRAYTLIELIIVIAILGLAGAVLVPQIVGRESMVTQAAVRQIISDLSFAQSDALSHQEYRRVHFYDDGSGYCIIRMTEAGFDATFDPDTADYIVDPLHQAQGGNYIINFVTDDRFEGITLSNVSIDNDKDYITYDEIGGTVMTGESPGTGGSVTVNGGTSSYRITIAPFTGKLTVQKLS